MFVMFICILTMFSFCGEDGKKKKFHEGHVSAARAKQ